jgi:DNA-binding NtrC family response regulator
MGIGLKRQTILIVDDDQVILKALSTTLAAHGFTVVTAEGSSEALEAVREASPDLILLDVNFPPDVANGGGSWDGLVLMSWIRQMFGKIPTIIMSGTDTPDVRKRAAAMRAVRFMQKPLGHGELLAVVRDALSARAETAAP